MDLMGNFYSTRINSRLPRKYQFRKNHLTYWNEKEFINRFRLSKQSVKYVLRQIYNKIKPRVRKIRKYDLTPMQKLLLTLRFYATGNFLITVGDFIGVSKMTASRIVKQVTEAIASLRPKFIKFPKTINEMKETSTNFYTIAKFPRCCGAIDCTHVRIRCPVGNIGEIYRNRKGYFSINVQTIGDKNLKVLDIVARWPGSAHDATIFNNSRIKTFLESDAFKNFHIVADKGYALKPYCLTPISSPETNAEQLYNESIIRTRNCVERKYGVMKRRFPILALGMSINLDTAINVIVACSVLHNIAIEAKETMPNLSADIIEAVENDIEMNRHFDVDAVAHLNSTTIRTQNDRAKYYRQHLILNYFNSL